MLAERSKEYGSKGWSWLKGAYVSAASHVESMAQENGYKVDLGELPANPPTLLCPSRGNTAFQDNVSYLIRGQAGSPADSSQPV